MIEPLCFSQDHIEEIRAGQVAKKASRGDGQDGFGNHRLDHQIDQGIELVFVQLDDTAVALDKLVELVFVEIIGPFVGIGPAANDGELQHGIGQVGDGRGNVDRIEIEQGRDFVFGEEHITGMPVAMNNLTRPGVEAELANTDTRIVIEHGECFGGLAHFPVRKGRAVGANCFEMPADGGRIVEAADGRLLIRVAGQEAMKFG